MKTKASSFGPTWDVVLVPASTLVGLITFRVWATSSLRELGDVAHVWPQALLSHFTKEDLILVNDQREHPSSSPPVYVSQSVDLFLNLCNGHNLCN